MQRRNFGELEMDLHGKIMNIRGDASSCTMMPKPSRDEASAYWLGHRDARHAAAEMALDADAAMEEAAKIIKELCECYGHPMPNATLARLLGAA